MKVPLVLDFQFYAAICGVAEAQKAQKESTAKALGLSVEEVDRLSKEVDPDQQGFSFQQWVLKMWKSKKFELPKDSDTVLKVLSEFSSLAKSGRLGENPRDITKYRDLESVKAVVVDLLRPESVDYSTLNGGWKLEQDGVSVVGYNSGYVMVSVTVAESASELAQGSQWCFRGLDYARRYTDPAHGGPIYVIFKIEGPDLKPAYAFQHDFEEFKTVKNVEVSEEEIPSVISDLVVGAAKKEGFRVVLLLERFGLDRIPYQYAEDLIKEPKGAVDYAVALRKEMPQLEPVILQSPEESLRYAQKVLKRVWPEAEDVIYSDFVSGWTYFINVVGDGPDTVLKREPRLERHLVDPTVRTIPLLGREGRYIQASELCFRYMVLTDFWSRWPELEDALLARGELSFVNDYFGRLEGERWPAYEKWIFDSSHIHTPAGIASVIDYLKGGLVSGLSDYPFRWEAAEPFILENGKLSEISWYAKNIIRDRWKEAESVLASSLYDGAWYGVDIKRRFPQWEKNLKDSLEAGSSLSEERLMKAMTESISPYFRMLKRFDPDGLVEVQQWFEPWVVSKARPAALYARDILEAPFPEAETVIGTSPQAMVTYLEIPTVGAFPPYEEFRVQNILSIKKKIQDMFEQFIQEDPNVPVNMAVNEDEFDVTRSYFENLFDRLRRESDSLAGYIMNRLGVSDDRLWFHQHFPGISDDSNDYNYSLKSLLKAVEVLSAEWENSSLFKIVVASARGASLAQVLKELGYIK